MRQKIYSRMKSSGYVIRFKKNAKSLRGRKCGTCGPAIMALRLYSFFGCHTLKSRELKWGYCFIDCEQSKRGEDIGDVFGFGPG